MGKKDENKQTKAKGVGHAPSDMNQKDRTQANKDRHIAQAKAKAAHHKEPHTPHGTARARARHHD